MYLGLPSLGLVRRELLSTMRRPRTYALLAVFVAGVIVLAIVGWPAGEYQLAQAAAFSREFLYAATVVLFLACGLFVPALAANSVTLERERHTFDLLQLTLIRPDGMVFAKLVNSVGFFILLTVASLPVLSVAFFLVGIDLGEVAQLEALVMMSAITCALVGIAISARSRSVLWSILGSYLFIILIICVVPWILLMFWLFVWVFVAQLMRFAIPFPGFGTFIAISSPVATTGSILEGSLSTWPFVFSMVSQAAVAVLCFRLAVRSLTHVPESLDTDREPPKPIDDPVILQMRRRKYPFYLIDPLRPKKPVEDHRNPMWVKETRWGLITRGSVLARMTYCAVILYFFLGVGTFLESGSYDTMLFWLMSQIVVTVLVAPALVANTLTKERELGNLDMLRMTLLEPRQVVMGKLLAGALSVGPLLLAAFISALEGALFLELHQWALMGTAYATLAVCCWLCFALSLLASMITQRTTSALVLSYFFSFLAFVGLTGLARVIAPFAMARFVGVPVAQVPRDMLDRACALLSPIALFVENARANGRLGPDRLGLINGYWLGGIAVFVLLALLLTVIAIRTFAQHHMRDV